MSRAMWRGEISFGLVNIAVRLYPATRHLDVRFRELDKGTGRRLRHQRVLSASAQGATAAGGRQPALEAPPGPLAGVPAGEDPAPYPLPRPVPAAEVIKGFEVAANRYVTVTETELEELAPDRSRSIDIEQFVSRAEVDPIYFDTSYYVVPVFEHARSFTVLLEGMAERDRLAISWIVLRRKRHLAALRPFGDRMVLSTMFHSDEVLPVEQPVSPPTSGLTQRERDMASLLIDTLTGPFEPQRYRDEYRERLLALLDRRASSQRRVEPEPERQTSPTAIEDLMAALQASVEQARQAKAATPGRQQRRRRREA